MELDTNIYNVSELDKLLVDISFIKNNKKIEYANTPCVIDIESSSFYENGEKRAIMYAFVLGINGKCIIGRTYNELIDSLKKISDYYFLNIHRRMIFYVHNLSFEFQFFRKHFIWNSVFGIDERKVAYALNDLGIELRCSYLLSGYSLDYIGKNLLTKYKVNKKVGDLDYSKIRHSKTLLSKEELNYILYDGLVVMAYIQEQIENHKDNINYLPLTKTGAVRDYCRKKCLYAGKHHEDTYKYKRYRRIMNNIKISSIQEYDQLKRGFSGGFTHANAMAVDKVIKNVTSYDFTSSYPAVMVMERYPMGNGKIVNIKSMEDFKENLKYYCCLFDATFIDLESITYIEHPISESKCSNIENVTIDNGRVVNAKKITITLTEQDFYIIKDFYKWKHMYIKNFRRYFKDYLPTAFVKAILELYKDKTTLKGVENKEVEYIVSKERVNSLYGCCVTDICRDDLTYNDIIENIEKGGWEITACDKEKALKKYNNSTRRFLAYQWGVWVTAYARRNLFSGIKECGDDYIYSDTDSIKIINAGNHLEYINKYNENVKQKLKYAMNFHGLDMSYVEPLTIKGEKKTLGVWDYDGFYEEFKTLGAKRYMVKSKEGFTFNGVKYPYSLTISGLSKISAIPYLYKKYKDKIMEHFTDEMYIPPEHTGKMTHTYLDFEQIGVVKDYNGIIYEYHELSSIHLENCEYELSLAKDFIDYLRGIKEYDE